MVDTVTRRLAERMSSTHRRIVNYVEAYEHTVPILEGDVKDVGRIYLAFQEINQATQRLLADLKDTYVEMSAAIGKLKEEEDVPRDLAESIAAQATVLVNLFDVHLTYDPALVSEVLSQVNDKCRRASLGRLSPEELELWYQDAKEIREQVKGRSG